MADDEIHYTIADAPEPPEAAPAAGAASQQAEPADETPTPDSDELGGGVGARTGPGDAWREVLTQIDALGDSMSRWVTAAANDPENRRHASEIKAKLEAVGEKVGAAMDDAAQSDVGKSVQEAAEKTGKAVAEIGGKVATEAGPAVATALSGIAGLLGKAADRVGRAASRPDETQAADDVADTAVPAAPADDGAGAGGTDGE